MVFSTIIVAKISSSPKVTLLLSPVSTCTLLVVPISVKLYTNNYYTLIETVALLLGLGTN